MPIANAEANGLPLRRGILHAMAPQTVRQIPRPRVTWAEYRQLPDDGNRYEVLEGELVVIPAPEYRHQSAFLNIIFLLEVWRRRQRDPGKILGAPFDVLLADDTIVQPDILYMSEQTRRLIVEGRLHGAPDLAIEIFNARGAARDRVSKLQIYARFLVKEYWLVDLEARSIMMLALREDGTYEQFASGTGDSSLASRILAGFSLKPSDAFEDC